MNELATVQPQDLSLVGASGNWKLAADQQLAMNNYIADQLKDGTDYGKIPGTGKKSLYKPGAEKLLYFNGFGARIEPTDKCERDWKNGFFFFEYKAVIFHKRTGVVVAECIGSANSLETKYRWNWLPENKLPRGIDKDSLESKEGQYGMLYRLDHPNPADQVNTLQKMGQKRAIVGGAILACRASENFSSEIEEGDEETAPQPVKLKEQAQQQAAPPESQPPADTISEAQGKRFYAKCKGSGKTDEQIKAYLSEKYGWNSTRQIARDKYDELCAWADSREAA